MLGILLVLHGSRIKEWVDTAIGYTKLLQKHFPLVEYGFLEINEPDIRKSLEKLVEKGTNEVVVVPLLFAGGIHFKKDIPEKLGIKDGKTLVKNREVKIYMAEPIGVDERVVLVILDKINKAINQQL
jgi:sirohydrochlorin cobaltochelatase